MAFRSLSRARLLVVTLTALPALLAVGAPQARAVLSVPRAEPAGSVAALRADVARTGDRLAKATVEWQKSRQRLEQLLQRKYLTGVQAEQLQEEAALARERMSLLANSLYRNPIDPMMMAVLRGDVEGITTVHIGRKALGITTEDQRRAAELFANGAQQVQKLLAEQDAAAADAIKQQLRLDDQLYRLQSDASASYTRLQAELERIRKQREAASQLGTGPGATCSAPLPADAVNGFLPISALCPLPAAPGHRLVAPAAAGFNRMAAAFAEAFGTALCVTDSYRDYGGQVAVFKAKPNLAATPGRSNHGWGRALDLCGGVQRAGSPPYEWLKEHAGEYGWVHPDWAEPDGSKPEPWHWEFRG